MVAILPVLVVKATLCRQKNYRRRRIQLNLLNPRLRQPAKPDLDSLRGRTLRKIQHYPNLHEVGADGAENPPGGEILDFGAATCRQ